MPHFFQLVAGTFGGLLSTVIVAIAVYAAWTGQDYVQFSLLKTTNPRQYRRLKSIGLVNGPLVALMCIGGIIGSPFAALAPDGGILAALFLCTVSAIFLWLSVRWMWWAWHA